MGNVTMRIRFFAFLLGLSFFVAGVGGFIPLFAPQVPAGAPHLHISTNYGLLLGLFPVNLVHNLFHLLTGAAGLWSARSYDAARRFCQFAAVALGLLAVLGLIPALNTLFGVLPLYGHDVWLHGLEAVVAAYLGFVVRAPAGDKEVVHVV